MTHDDLALSLAAHLRTDKRMTWCDMQLGPQGSPRPDVYAIFKSYSNPCPTSYEVKVSMSDFRADVTAGKWQSYLQFSHGVYFACEGDLLTKADIPSHCGLIVLRTSWRIVKRAVLSPCVIPQDACLKLLIDGINREGPTTLRSARFDSVSGVRKISEKFGQIVADTVRDRFATEDAIELAKRQAEYIKAEAQNRAELIRKEAEKSVDPLRREICEIFGLPADTSGWRLKGEVRRLREDQAVHPAIEQLRLLTLSIRSILDRNGYKEPEMKTEEVST